MDVTSLITSCLRASEEQWVHAGGHILSSSSAGRASRDAFSLLQTATALDHAAIFVREALKELNAATSDKDASSQDAAERNVRPCIDKNESNAASQPPRGAYEEDDVSDGSALQGGLIARNVLPNKPLVYMTPGEPASSPHDGTPRLIAPGVLSPEECDALVAGGLVAMAGAFTRCGQTTLGLSPALAGRTLAAPPPPSSTDGASSSATTALTSIPQTVPLLYRTMERIRRRVATAFGAPLETLRLSDATLTRLQPLTERPSVAEGDVPVEAASASGSLDVGLLRGDQFCYWRPHIDQVSVDEYEYSALLYLTRHSVEEDKEEAEAATVDVSEGEGKGGGGRGGDFTGGKLIFHDEDADRVVLPEPGLLVSFTSGAANLHAVQRVTHGSRFALTMWFTHRREAAAADPTHVAMQQWAGSLPDDGSEAEAALLSVPPPPLAERFGSAMYGAMGSGRKVPTREENLVSAAMCSLPANDPLQRALILVSAGQLGATMHRGLGVAAPRAHAAPRTLETLAAGEDLAAPAAAGDADLEALKERLRPLLQSRISALEALVTTLRRARAERSQPSSTAPPDAASTPAGVKPPAGAAAAPKGGEDAFSVFDF